MTPKAFYEAREKVVAAMEIEIDEWLLNVRADDMRPHTVGGCTAYDHRTGECHYSYYALPGERYGAVPLECDGPSGPFRVAYGQATTKDLDRVAYAIGKDFRRFGNQSATLGDFSSWWASLSQKAREVNIYYGLWTR